MKARIGYERYLTRLAAAAAGLLASGLPLAAQVQVFPAVHQDVSQPLRDMAKRLVPTPTGSPQERFLGAIPLPPAMPVQDPVEQLRPLPYQAFTAGAGFDGLGMGFPGFSVQFAPPDTNAAVGQNNIVQWVNASFVIFDKAGNIVQGPTPGNALWSGFGGGCETNNDGDPIVKHDQLVGRWIFTQFSVSTTPYLQCVAVSTSEDPTGTYNRYSFSFGNNNFPDYPKLGVWPDAYYMTFNMFLFARFFQGPNVCAVDRQAALTGAAATMQCFQQRRNLNSLLPADLDGLTPPPAGAPNYIVGFGTNSLNVLTFHVDFSTPANSVVSSPVSVPVAPFTPACNGGTCIPQVNTRQQLDSLADRLMYRLAYRNRSGVESLVVNHSVQTSNSVSGVRWYELRNVNGTPGLYQQGTFSPDSTARWMGSIAMDGCGNMALGYSVSSSTINPGIRLTGRLATDPLNQLQTETNAVTGAGSQVPSLSRWGDYSSMAVDPVDDSTFWYTTEYLKADGKFNWSTRLIPVKFGGCGP